MHAGWYKENTASSCAPEIRDPQGVRHFLRCNRGGGPLSGGDGCTRDCRAPPSWQQSSCIFQYAVCMCSVCLQIDLCSPRSVGGLPTLGHPQLLAGFASCNVPCPAGTVEPAHQQVYHLASKGQQNLSCLRRIVVGSLHLPATSSCNAALAPQASSGARLDHDTCIVSGVCRSVHTCHRQ